MMKIINSIPEEVIDKIKELLVNPSLFRSNLIGSGTHGQVYRLFDKYAVKLFSGRAIKGNQLDYTCLEKLQGIAYIPKLYAYLDQSFMVMEYVEGQNLVDYYYSHEKHLPPEFIYQLSDAITQIFDKLIIPEDFKLFDHVIINKDTGSFKLIDLAAWESCAIMSPEYINRIKKHTIDFEIENINKILPYTRKDEMGIEKVTLADDDTYVCTCNEFDFRPVDPKGEDIEHTSKEWDGQYLVCNYCGRMFNTKNHTVVRVIEITSLIKEEREDF